MLPSYYTVGVLLLLSVVLECSSKSVTSKNQRLEQLERKIDSIERHFTKLVTALLDGKDENGHEIRKREISSNNQSDDDPLRWLPIHALTGLRGSPGRDGRDGKDGDDGRDGSKGDGGRDGADGKDGTNGRDGRDGAPGVAGQPGVTGPPGASGPRGLRGEPGQPAEGGGVYTRWGRTICGNQSTLLYHGFAAGSYYTHAGGGTDYQCLPPSPEYSRYSSSSATPISGAEYHGPNTGVFPTGAYHQNVPCARCFTNSRSAVMMLPAKRTCPDTWNKEYEGYLMTAYYGHAHPTTHECVDSSPEYIAGESSSTHGALFYFIKADCSGTGTTGHCPPYDARKELTCVVCSK